MNKSSLAKSAYILISLTLFSKFLGFGREIVIAFLFGATAFTDAYLMALTIPTLLFVAMSKAIGSVFIPVYDKFKTEKRELPLLVKFSTLGLLAAGAFVLLFVVFAPQLVSLFAVGFDKPTAALTVEMLRILAFIIIFRFLSDIFTAVLHVNKNFVIPGLESLPYNIVVIAVSFLLYQRLGISALVWGTLFGIISQTLFIFPWMLRSGFSGGGWQDKSNDGIRELFSLLPAVILGSMATQIKAMIDRMFASTLAAGSISYLNYAGRLINLPQALLVMAVITVVYPTLASLGNAGEKKRFADLHQKTISSMQYLLIPIMIGLIILAEPIIQFVYQRGSFDAVAAAETVAPLRYFSLGLLGVMLTLFNMRALYALKDTKAPLIATAVMIVVNTVLNLAFIGPMGHGGLALATSISVWLGGLLLFWLLARKLAAPFPLALLAETGKTLAAGFVMGGAVYFLYFSLLSNVQLLGSIGALLASIASGAGIFFACSLVLKLRGAGEAKLLLQRILRRFSSTKM